MLTLIFILLKLLSILEISWWWIVLFLAIDIVIAESVKNVSKVAKSVSNMNEEQIFTLAKEIHDYRKINAKTRPNKPISKPIKQTMRIKRF